MVFTNIKNAVPDWDFIKDVTDDLRNIMDDIEEKEDKNALMRPKLARAIASMRVEKKMEGMNN